MMVFITGLTGTLGTAIAKVHRDRGDVVVGCARSEAKAVEWLRENPDLAILRLCDAKDLEQRTMLDGVNKLYHCAAMKHVDMCESDILEAVQQNVHLVDSVSKACYSARIPMVHISTDKACSPCGVYGATKLIAERIALQRGATVVRFDNLIGSSGSVFQLWKQSMDRGQRIRLTDRRMTRFFIPVREAAEYVISVPHRDCTFPTMKAACMGDVASALRPDFDEIGLR